VSVIDHLNHASPEFERFLFSISQSGKLQSGPETLSHPVLLNFSHPTIGSVFFKYRKSPRRNIL